MHRWLMTGGRATVAAFVVSVFVSVSSASALAPSAGSWTATGALTAARGFHVPTHQAITLANGKVLVEGGDGTNGTFSTAVANAETFDPSTNTWTATGSLSTARDYFTSTLLADGRVLVAGGYDASNTALASTEIYDPATGAWSAAAAMNVARGYHTATLLKDGRVLVVGGDTTSAWTPTANAEVYDPAANTWTQVASPREAHAAGVSALLPDGRVLVAGGYQPGGAIQQTGDSEVYNPATGAWTTVRSMATPRTCADVAVVGGRILVAGGENDSSGYVSSAELFDPTTGSWTATAAMRYRHACAASVQLSDGRVLVAGGLGPNARGLAPEQYAEVYTPSTGRWRQVTSLLTATYLGAAALLPDGRVVVAGGYGSNLVGLRASEVFTP